MLRWMTNLTFSKKFQLFDLFSGAANVSKAWHLDSYGAFYWFNIACIFIAPVAIQ